jgi:hypothetical protein
VRLVPAKPLGTDLAEEGRRNRATAKDGINADRETGTCPIAHADSTSREILSFMLYGTLTTFLSQ